LGLYDGRRELRWLTIEDFQRQAAAVAVQLAERGLGRGQVCLVVLPSEELAATVVLAVLLLGAVPLLVAPPLLHGGRLELPRLLGRCARRTGARLAVCADSLVEMRDQLGPGAGRVRWLFAQELRLDGSGADLPTVLPPSTAVAALQLTSGTTGTPRICVWDQRGVLTALDGMSSAMALAATDVCCNWTPLYHDMGLVNNFLLCLTAGVPLVLLSPHEFIKRPATWLRALAEAGATHTWSPNFGFAVAVRKIADQELSGVRLDHVRAFWNAAERIHLHTIEAFHRRFAPLGVRREALKTNYGCAENVGGATFSDGRGAFVYEHLDRELLHGRGVARPIPEAAERDGAVPVVGVGRPHPGIAIRILSRRGEPLPDGRVGEIALQTPSRLLRYERDARATRRALHGELLRTGDLGYLRDGELFWVGRLRERITIQGRKVDPSGFESALATIAELRPGCFAAFGIDEPRLGTQRVVIAAEVREPLTSPVAELQEQVRRRIFEWLGVAVSEVLLVTGGTLAKTSSGKRRHRHFRRLYLEGTLQPLAISAAVAAEDRGEPPWGPPPPAAGAPGRDRGIELSTSPASKAGEPRP
jgi:acyl-CoA synthetase (AMP-forming)/AMP-acid ligase II